MKRKTLPQLYAQLRHYYHLRHRHKSHRVRKLLSSHMDKLQRRITQKH